MRPTEKALREALTEILRVHANDNPKPKAFYIAADAALFLPETVGEPVAWATPDGERCIPSHTKNAALKDGGAMLSSVACFTVPCYAAPAAPEAK